MLEVQKYLIANGLDKLQEEFAIKVVHHPELPLLILNYHQIDSKPRTHPIVRECRGLVLDKTDWSIVAKSFNRFFNWGEVLEEAKDFDFSNCFANQKIDGSLCLIYNYQGKWHGNTRGSFGLDALPDHPTMTWREGFLKAMGVENWDELDKELDPAYTYVCEFTSPYNKVVKKHHEFDLWLLGMFEKEREVNRVFVDPWTMNYSFPPFKRPIPYYFKDIDNVLDYISMRGSEDPTWEGVVLNDGKTRWKVKNPKYLSLHAIRGEGDNRFNPKYILPWVLDGEGDELLTYYSEVTEVFHEVKNRVDEHYSKLEETWKAAKDIENQKEFALAVVGKTQFSGILFSLRKTKGKEQTLDDLKDAWRKSEDTILKYLF